MGLRVIQKPQGAPCGFEFLRSKPRFLVGVTGLEPAASKSQTSRATNCATPRFCIEFLSFCVEVGQTVVKPDFYAFLRFCKVPKTRINKGFFALLFFRSGVGYARSQTKRLTIGPHSEKHRAIIVPFFGGKVKRGRKGFAKRWLTKGEGYAIICTN